MQRRNEADCPGEKFDAEPGLSKDESVNRSQECNATERKSDAPKGLFPPDLLTPEELADLRREFRETGEWMSQELQRQKASNPRTQLFH